MATAFTLANRDSAGIKQTGYKWLSDKGGAQIVVKKVRMDFAAIGAAA
jgi:hypothetical protein